MSSAGPGCKGNIWWDHSCTEASDTWSETGPLPLNDCSVFSCLQLVFCFMDYSDSRVTVFCVCVCMELTKKQHCFAGSCYANPIVWFL